MTQRQPVRVCFVCLGNICRSPTAEGILLHLVRLAGLEGRVSVDSAGTAAYHTGEPPDARSVAAAKRHGVSLVSRARAFVEDDFERFDWVLAMDRQNRDDLIRLAPSDEARGRVHLLREFDPNASANAEVPDPYYGGNGGFDDVFAICEVACRGLLSRIGSSLAPHDR